MTLLRYLALAGPTACGKTDAALALAQACVAQGRRPIEIVSVDSALVYRGMDIGTAKPEPAQLDAVPHHLIDVIEPTAAYSAAEFVRDAERLIDAIHARGAFPLLVGGTMLYFKALFDGLDALPQADPTVRAEIDARARVQGWPALHAELARIDPVTAERLAPLDAQRIQRALEVWAVSGRPLSSFHTGRFEEARREGHREEAAPADHVLFSLEPTDRAWLHKRIEHRFDQMLAQGFLAEVQRLRARGDLQPELPSMRCVGYRQAWEALDEAADADPLPTRLAAELRERGIAATRQLAKRQITWLRSMPQRQVLACDTPGVQDAWLAAALPLVPPV